MTGCRSRTSCSASSSSWSSWLCRPSGSATPWPCCPSRARPPFRLRLLLVVLAALLGFSNPATADGESAEALLERFLRLGEISSPELQCLVEDAGGLLFRAPVE